MEPSPAGIAALALFVLVLGYWVPQRVRHRQQLLDARLEDRFSEGLRVLAVGARGPVPALASASGADLPGLAAADEPVGLLTMSSEPQPIKVPVPPPASGGRAREESPMAPQPSGARSRLAVLELRARRARRRLWLTIGLLLVTAAVWVAVYLTPLLWYAGLVPLTLLAVVLVLGRTAAASARRADARWAAERRSAERQALQARALARGGPRAPVNRARVTGRAVHGSDAMTQMIPKVSIRVVDGVAEAVPASSENASEVPEPRVVETPVAETTTPEPVTEAPVAEPAPGPTSSYAPGAAAKAMTRPPAPATTAIPSPRTWEARPVPLPTYVTKPAAPRREPRPLTGTTPVPSTPVSTGWSSTPWQRVEDSGEQVGPADTSWSLGATQDAALGATATPAEAAKPDATEPDPLVAEDPRPRTETLGLPLEQILARRRAAG